MHADRTLLTATMWAGLSPLLPGQAGCRGPTARATRGLVEAVLWLGRTGVARRDLPPLLGHWHRVGVRFARRRDAGAIPARATHGLIAHKRRVPVGSTSIRVQYRLVK